MRRRALLKRSNTIGTDHDLPSVLIVCPAWGYDQVGGAFKIATEFAEYLAVAGHRVFYVCGTHDPAAVNPSVERGVELWRYPYPRQRSPHPANLLAHVLRPYRLTRRILRSSPIACINGHMSLEFFGASLAAPSSCRKVYSIHSPFAAEMECNFEGRAKSLKTRAALALARWIDRRNCQKSTVIQCFSQFTASAMISLCKRHIATNAVVSPGWVDVKRFQPHENIQALRETLGPPWLSASPVFLAVRRLESRMGLDRLVEAAALLKRKKMSFRLLIGGSGSLANRLREEIDHRGLQETVYLLGRIPDERLANCYAAADCFVLPTRALECFGLIILEAYASGIPVIATPVGAIPELVSFQGNEWLTKDTTAEAIAERMEAFLHGRLVADRQQLPQLARRWRAELGLAQLAKTVLP
jgi:glycosyltransferase involved in cell wall biosynthesis